MNPTNHSIAADAIASGTCCAVAPDELLGHLNVDAAYGLDDARVEQMRERYGANRLPEVRPKSKVRLFLEQFNNPLIYILFGAAVLTTIVSDIAEAATIFFVVVFNAIIGYVQEQRAGERLKAVKGLSAPTARVVRDGEQRSVPTGDVVVGDIVLLESGVRVPADVRLVETIELSIDESMLTGETLPVLKQSTAAVTAEAALGDRVTMAYAGATVRKGRGRGVVVSVGERSEIGKISKGIAEAVENISPLEERLARFGKVMALAIVIVIVVLFGIGLLRGYNATQMLLTSVGLAVSAIPEGLPIAVTVALSIGVYQMARRNAIVRRMNAVETLGSTTVICSDKTGTLTRNQMTTVMIASGDRIYSLTGGGYDPAGSLLDDADEPTTVPPDSPLEWTLRIGLFCTESSFRDTHDDGGTADGAASGVPAQRELVGDPTEGAMIVAAEKAGIAKTERERWRMSVVLPFESERMYMASRIDGERESVLLVKGSVERILTMCEREMCASGVRPLERSWIEERQAQLSKRGLRVIATAYLPLDEGATPDGRTITGAIFAGLHGIEDPPRDEARTAVADARSAGIAVVMITGDHEATAVSIAAQLGISAARGVRSIAGTRLAAMSDDDLFDVVDRTDVYARVAPEHKLRIVRQLQRHGHVAAMTGDGVNDAPALKQADIGVAMGSGTDVAKEAAAVVVLDDNFATIVSAIRYGRVMFRNLQHMVLYVLATSLGGVLTLAAAVVLGYPLPVIAVQLLWINLVTDGTSTIPLAYEKEHGDIMLEPPRKRSDGLLNWQMGERIVGAAVIMMFGTIYVFERVFDHHGFNAFSKDIPADVLALARTAAFTTLALCQIWNVHNSRAIRHSILSIGLTTNMPLLVVTAVAFALQVAAVELPFMNPLLGTVPMPGWTWLLCIGASLTLVVLVELRKLAGRFYERAKNAK